MYVFFFWFIFRIQMAMANIGFQHTISIPLKQEMKSRDVRQLYQDRYAGERLIKIIGESPLVKNIAGKHGVEVGGFAVHSSGRRVVVNATIDNLLKGAATQCLRKFLPISFFFFFFFR